MSSRRRPASRHFPLKILSFDTDRERRQFAIMASELTDGVLTAGVSYVGNANFGDAERYVRDFRLHTNSIGITPLLEISSVGGRFIISFIQPFEDDRYVNAFLDELIDSYIAYDLLDAGRVRLPGVELPWK